MLGAHKDIALVLGEVGECTNMYVGRRRATGRIAVIGMRRASKKKKKVRLRLRLFREEFHEMQDR